MSRLIPPPQPAIPHLHKTPVPAQDYGVAVPQPPISEFFVPVGIAFLVGVGYNIAHDSGTPFLLSIAPGYSQYPGPKRHFSIPPTSPSPPFYHKPAREPSSP